MIMALDIVRCHGALRVQFLFFFLFLITFLCRVKAHTANSSYDRVTLLKKKEGEEAQSSSSNNPGAPTVRSSPDFVLKMWNI